MHRRAPPRRRREAPPTSGSTRAEESDTEATNGGGGGEAAASGSSLARGLAARVREVLSLQPSGVELEEDWVHLDDALAVTGLVAELTQAAAAAATAAETADDGSGDGSSSRVEALGARALHAAVFVAPLPAAVAASALPGESVCAALAGCWQQAACRVRVVFDSARKLAAVRRKLGILDKALPRGAESSASRASEGGSDDDDVSALVPDGAEARALALYLVLDECVTELFATLRAATLLQPRERPQTVAAAGSLTNQPSQSRGATADDAAAVAAVAVVAAGATTDAEDEAFDDGAVPSVDPFAALLAEPFLAASLEDIYGLEGVKESPAAPAAVAAAAEAATAAAAAATTTTQEFQPQQQSPSLPESSPPSIDPPPGAGGDASAFGFGNF
jgi:hypothetical protein